MPTADEVLDIERSFLGEGGERFWAWYPAAPGTAWCDIFQSYCLTAVGIPTHFAWVSAHFDYYRSQGRCSYDIATATPGALIAFEWNQTPGGYDHIAMVESVDLERGGVYAINGNVNGSRVQRLWHPFNGGGIAEVAFPEYSTPTPPPIGKADMVRFIRPKSSPKVYLIDAEFVGGSIHAKSEQALKDLNWALTNTPGATVVAPPAGAAVENIAGVAVWVVSDAFASTLNLAS